MASYLFRCEKCKKDVEIEIPMNEYSEKKDKQKCECGEKMNRVLTPVGSPIYECGGFYCHP